MKRNELYIQGIQANNKNQANSLSNLTSQYEKNEVRRKLYILNFAVTNAAYDVSPYIALNYLSSSDVSVLDTINNSMSDEVRNGVYGGELDELVTQIKATSVGNKLPELVQKDTAGVDVKIENPNGFLLLRFWSSQDNTSRSSNDFIRKLYDNYDQEDLKIVSSAIDSQKEEWIKAVQEDQVPWLQVSDLEGTDGQAVRKLAIRTLPENLLVDHEGIIVGRNLYIEEIEKILKEYIKTKPVAEKSAE